MNTSINLKRCVWFVPWKSSCNCCEQNILVFLDLWLTTADGKRVWSADGGEIGPRGYGEWTFKEAQHVNLRFYLNWKSDTNSWEVMFGI